MLSTLRISTIEKPEMLTAYIRKKVFSTKIKKWRGSDLQTAIGFFMPESDDKDHVILMMRVKQV